MTRKALFIRLKNLVLSTSNEWKNIADDKREGKDVIGQFSLPLLGFITIATFIGYSFNNQGFEFETAFKLSLSNFASAYGSIYVAMLLINLTKPIFHLQTNSSKALSFVGYAYGLYFAIEIITNLFPEFYLLRILILYTVFIVWEGVIPMFKVREEQRTGFALVCSIIILLTPWVLNYILKLIIPGNSIV